MDDPFPMIRTGRGGVGLHGGIGGRGGDIHLHSHNSVPGFLDGLLMSLPRADYASHDSAREDLPSPCLEGTRVAILKDIMSWLECANGNRPPVYWLSGLAGIGKSTIAKTVTERAEEKALLGASFFFSRSGRPLWDPRLVFPTLAFQLAQSDRTFKDVIVKALRKDPTLGHKEPSSQFQKLILKPLLEIDCLRRPTLIILDALDECEEKGAADILRLLFSRATKIPPFLRILITSRPRPHLSSLFNQARDLEKMVLHEVEAETIQQDIRFYISTELAKIPEKLDLRMPADWATERERNSLIEKSGKLFVYAATALRFIGDDRVPDPRGNLSLILNSRFFQQAGVTPYSQLDDLYMGVLRNSLSSYNRRENVRRFQIIVGSIALLRMPLPLDSLARFVHYEADVVEASLRHLHSVIVPPSSIHGAPRIYHPSFLEFIINPSRCSIPEFVIIPVPKQELRHALRCFELMGEHLKWDIAGISDPSLLNGKLDGLERKMRDALPLEVQYACRYWVSHLSYVEWGERKMVEALETFSLRSLLRWFEAMSLMGSILSVASLLQQAHHWVIRSKCKPTLVTMLSDAYRFILAHREVIRESMLHVHLSALPFTPQKTVLYKTFWKDRKDCIRVLQGVESEWPQSLSTLLGHSDSVSSIAFSPDGLSLVSGSSDRTLRLWDAISGAHIAKLEGHSGLVMSVAFSPNGSSLASGSKDRTVMLWNAISGASIAKLEGHSGWVTSVAFSPDGLHLASGFDGLHLASGSHGLHSISGSKDCTLQLWHATSHMPIKWDAISHTPIKKLESYSHSVTSVAFSPDGLYLASGSGDHTLQLWDATSGAPVATLEGHSASVTSVAWSPDGACLASGSKDHTLWLWDTISRAPIAKLEGHSDCVMSVAFSPDGLCLASGSDDCTIQWWGSGTPIAKLKGHSGSVTSVAFSPDGLCLASGSCDHTIWLWDAIQGTPIIQLNDSGLVTSIAFSPNGLCLASGSDDLTLQLWDTKSGALIHSILQGRHPQDRAITFSPDSSTLISGIGGEALMWDLTSQPPQRIFSTPYPLAPEPFMGMAPLIWSLDSQWVQVAQPESGHIRHICRIPPYYSSSLDIVVSSNLTQPHIAIGCKDGRVIILAAPLDPFNSLST